jgi:hypothetical protein
MVAITCPPSTVAPGQVWVRTEDRKVSWPLKAQVRRYFSWCPAYRPAHRHHPSDLAGSPPSLRVRRYGRQPAYWLLGEQAIRQADLEAVLDRSGG